MTQLFFLGKQVSSIGCSDELFCAIVNVRQRLFGTQQIKKGRLLRESGTDEEKNGWRMLADNLEFLAHALYAYEVDCCAFGTSHALYLLSHVIVRHWLHRGLDTHSKSE